MFEFEKLDIVSNTNGHFDENSFYRRTNKGNVVLSDMCHDEVEIAAGDIIYCLGYVEVHYTYRTSLIPVFLFGEKVCFWGNDHIDYRFEKVEAKLEQ